MQRHPYEWPTLAENHWPNDGGKLTRNTGSPFSSSTALLPWVCWIGSPVHGWKAGVALYSCVCLPDGSVLISVEVGVSSRGYSISRLPLHQPALSVVLTATHPTAPAQMLACGSAEGRSGKCRRDLASGVLASASIQLSSIPCVVSEPLSTAFTARCIGEAVRVTLLVGLAAGMTRSLLLLGQLPAVPQVTPTVTVRIST